MLRLLKQQYKEKKRKIEKRLGEFSNVKGENIFYELCFCLMTPQSNAEKCWAAVERLKKKGFYKKEINPKKSIRDIRFYNNKTRYLLEAKKNFRNIKKDLDSMNNSFKLRDMLVKKIKGYGLKEASHFLRNIGRRDLAIIDRHILKNLKRFGVIRNIPQSINNKEYIKIEKKFKLFSKRINIPLDALDLLFWSMETGKIFK